MKKNFLVVAMATFMANNAQADLGDLLITEIAIASTAPDYLEAEFVEIYNNGDTAIDLSDVYLTDASFQGNDTSPPAYYYEIVKGNGNGGGTGNFFDFHARFPDGATIQPGSYQTVSINGSTGFVNDYGVSPTYELYEDGGSPDGVPDMREAFPSSIANVVGFSDEGEVFIMYTWDGTSDLVQDLDYIVWGDRVEGVDKTGVSIDSATDADNTSSTYLPDIERNLQTVISASAHAIGNSWQRVDLLEGTETSSGGNGINGHDETSENTDTTFLEALPTPNQATVVPPPGAPDIIINEVDAVGTAEFIEIYDGGDGNTSLDDVTVVLYDGDTDQVYATFPLTGMSTDNSGYFLLGNATTPAPDVTLPVDSLQDGADAVAIYFDSPIAVNDALTLDNIIDAFVYDSDDADDNDLLALLNANQPQVNENSNGLANSESSARCANGEGGTFNTASYLQVAPTPGNVNSTCPIDGYYASITPGIAADSGMLRTALHNLIDDHTEFSYSGGFPDACDILEDADEDPSNQNNVWMVYSNESYVDGNACSGSYNREHTWPRSRFTGENESTPGRDTHQLMATTVSYNSDRGNRYFDNCLTGCSNSGLTTTLNNGVGGSSDRGDSNWRNNGVFEVWDYRKGDIARAMFYMDVRYEGDSGEPDLVLTDNTTLLNGGVENYMGLLSTLCEWHYADPVDNNDITRNEVIFSFQGNKNPFVDHPEWVAKVFESTPACLDPNADDLIFMNGFEQQ